MIPDIFSESIQDTSEGLRHHKSVPSENMCPETSAESDAASISPINFYKVHNSLSSLLRPTQGRGKNKQCILMWQILR